jgi:hypothetical protein
METKSVSIASGSRPLIYSAPLLLRSVSVLAWIAAAAMVFVPFARYTSAWDALTLHVPGDQGNWWHVLVGLPFFLAYPLAWLSVGRFLSVKPLAGTVSLSLIVFASVSALGTALVEAPFVAQRAGTSTLQRFEVIVLGLGILSAGVGVLLARRRRIGVGDTCLMAMSTAYLANLAICLIVYSEATGSVWSRAGWLASTVLAVPIGCQWLWLQFRMWTLPSDLAQ